MQIVEVLIYVLLIAGLTIYIHFEKRDSYQKGFSDGVEHYSKMVEEVLHQTRPLNTVQFNQPTHKGYTERCNNVQSEGAYDE